MKWILLVYSISLRLIRLIPERPQDGTNALRPPSTFSGSRTSDPGCDCFSILYQRQTESGALIAGNARVDALARLGRTPVVEWQRLRSRRCPPRSVLGAPRLRAARPSQRRAPRRAQGGVLYRMVVYHECAVTLA